MVNKTACKREALIRLSNRDIDKEFRKANKNSQAPVVAQKGLLITFC